MNASSVPIIAVPHQLPAAIWYVCPESIVNYNNDIRDENGERVDDEGLHDLHTWMKIEDALTYHGHQQAAVKRLFLSFLHLTSETV